MWQRLRPAVNIATRKLGRARTLPEASVETVVVQPMETELHDAPIQLPGQLAKAVASVPGHAPLEHEIARATATQSLHQPILRYTIQDCLVHPGGVEFRGGSVTKQRLQARPLASEAILRLDRALYAMSSTSHQYFGHWLQDACPTALLRQDDEALLLDVRLDWPHAAQYAQAFGLRPEPSSIQQVERLTIYDDHSQGSSKRERYAELRRRLEATFPGGASSPAVYLRRGSSGAARLVANEEAVVTSLAGYGFDVFDMGGASLRDMVQRFRHAEIVVSMDGSHLNHLYFAMPPGAALLTFVPADRFTMNQVGYTVAAGLRYGFMVVDPAPGGYEVSIPDLQETLALMRH
jgi:capsular polysaccharide biosynthesis protein